MRKEIDQDNNFLTAMGKYGQSSMRNKKMHFEAATWVKVFSILTDFSVEQLYRLVPRKYHQ